MAIATWFNRQSRLVQILLMLIPVVNWITEILVRWSAFLKTRSLITLVMAILVTFFGWISVSLDPRGNSVLLLSL